MNLKGFFKNLSFETAGLVSEWKKRTITYPLTRFIIRLNPNLKGFFKVLEDSFEVVF